MFYDGHPRAEPGAIVCRVAPSFLRFGNFELLRRARRGGLLTRLADYTLRHHFPELGAPSPETYAAWLTEIAAARPSSWRTGCGSASFTAS